MKMRTEAFMIGIEWLSRWVSEFKWIEETTRRLNWLAQKFVLFIANWKSWRWPKSMMKRLRNKFYMWNLYNWRSKTELKLNEDIMYKQVLDEACNDDGVVRKRMDNVIVFPPPQDYLGKVFDCLNYPIPFCSAWVWLSRGRRARSLSTWPSWPALVWCCTRM